MIRHPDSISKSLSIICIICFLIFLGIMAYLMSKLQDDNDITSDNFTISQALSFGNKPGMIIFLVFSISILSYLLYYRRHKYLYIRLLLLLLVCVCIIIIIWITPYNNNTTHFNIAVIIFTALILNIILNSYVIYNGLTSFTSYNRLYNRLYNRSHKNIELKQIILLAIPILAVIGYIGLYISNMKPFSQDVPQLFSAFENYICALNVISIFTIGFF